MLIIHTADSVAAGVAACRLISSSVVQIGCFRAKAFMFSVRYTSGILEISRRLGHHFSVKFFQRRNKPLFEFDRQLGIVRMRHVSQVSGIVQLAECGVNI